MECRICREEIKEGAKKCTNCGAFQNWRRFIDLGNSTLALVIALFSVASIGVPYLVDALRSNSARLIFSPVYWQGDKLGLAIENIGKGPGHVKSASIFYLAESDRMNALEYAAKSDKLDQSFFVGGSSRLIELEFQVPDYSTWATRGRPEEFETVDNVLFVIAYQVPDGGFQTAEFIGLNTVNEEWFCERELPMPLSADQTC